MEPEFITYQKFNDAALAAELTDLLQRHNIKYVMEEQSLTFNPTFVLNDELSMEYAVKISSDDFEMVNKIVAEEESANVDEVEKDYYLFDFSDEELMEIIATADEWSAFDFVLARKILGGRGVTLNDEAIAKAKNERIESLKKPAGSQNTWIILGYLFAFLGGVLGLFIGWHLSTAKKTLPDGERVYEYSEQDKKQGKRIFYISIVMTVISAILRLMPLFMHTY